MRTGFSVQLRGTSIEAMDGTLIMTVVLAIEPDIAQAEPLTALLRVRLGADLRLVTTSHAAIVAMNQQMPDVVLLGRDVPQEQRTRIVTHLRSLSMGDQQARAIELPKLDVATAQDGFVKKVGACLAAAEESRVRAMARTVGRPDDDEWNAVALEEMPEPAPAKTSGSPMTSPDDLDEDDELRLADVQLIEAEVEFRLQAELERLQAEAARQQAQELARVEAEASERRAREIARVEEE